jgi:hypothetical protein
VLDKTFPAGAFRVIENDVEKDFDGGRIVLAADNGEFAKTEANPAGDVLSENEKIMSITLTINYRKDEPMREWPSVRDEIAKRRFNIRVWEETP